MSKLTADEIDKMRAMIADHDAETTEGTDFDPSKVVVPYRYQKFPMMIYNHEQSYPAHDAEQSVVRGSLAVTEIVHIKAHLVSKVVHNQHELNAALEAGWSETPPDFRDEAEPELTGALAEQATQVDQKIADLQPRRRARHTA